MGEEPPVAGRGPHTGQGQGREGRPVPVRARSTEPGAPPGGLKRGPEPVLL